MTQYWTNESVLRFAGDRDPVDAVEAAAQQLVLDAVQHEWQGPPFDPFELARIRGIPVLPMQELRDARTVPAGGKVRIEYNPTRPPQRLRFSLAHEIAHTLFPDVAEAARYRNNPEHGPTDAWQLELLCNIAAGEILMPTASLPELRGGDLNIERLMALRREYGVSTEALLRRATKLSVKPVAMFAASRTDPQRATSPFRIDYAVPSLAWQPAVHTGQRRPADSVLAECTAVGFTARRREDWSSTLENIEVEAVGAPPFPEQRSARPRTAAAARRARGHGDHDQHRPRRRNGTTRVGAEGDRAPRQRQDRELGRRVCARPPRPVPGGAGRVSRLGSRGPPAPGPRRRAHR
jgi:hypothetical protein